MLIFLAGECFFLTFWHNPNGPIKIRFAFSLSSICQHSVSFGERQAGFKFRSAENRLSIGTRSCVFCFYFQKYPILLLSVELQLDGERLGQQEDGSASEFSCDTRAGFPRRLRNLFYSESFGAKHCDCVIFGNSNLALFRWLSAFLPFLWVGDSCGCSWGSSS